MQTFRFHVVALPHLPVAKEIVCCAFTSKIFRFCQMMKGLGHHVILYGIEGSDPSICTRFVPIMSKQENLELYGDHGHDDLYPLKYDGSLPIWVKFNLRAVIEISMVKRPRDFVCLIGGNAQKVIQDQLADLQVVEFGIGYTGAFAKYKVFESYNHMSAIYGAIGCTNNPSFVDAVIPNYYDPVDFPLETERENYLLFMGRLLITKGIDIAVMASKASGVPLYVAGQGARSHSEGKLTIGEGAFEAPGLRYLGLIGPKDRARYMGRAKALIAPSKYLEPFGSVFTEAQMCGTPCITTDWGAVAETVEHGVSGFRCRTLQHFVEAIKEVDKLDRTHIRENAIARWSMDRVKWMYQEYFSMLYTMHNNGMNALDRKNQDLYWLSSAKVRDAMVPPPGGRAKAPKKGAAPANGEHLQAGSDPAMTYTGANAAPEA